jgi:MYXO-CTERM domain-containing protein
MGARLGSLLVLAGTAAIGCAAEARDDREGAIGTTASAIINGTRSSADQDFVVQLGVETNGAITPECTATVVAENLILTARHCVGEVEGERMLSTHSADRIAIYVGADGPQQIASGAAPAARGAKVFTPAGQSLFPDIALVVLDQKIDAPIAALRLNGTPRKSEAVDVVGFGMNEDNVNVSVRMQRTVKVMALAPSVTTFHKLNEGEFAFGEAACFGDSGGPALSAATNAIVGVASRVNSGVASTDDQPNKICLGAEDVYTSLRPFKQLILQAFAAAGATPILEEGDGTTTRAPTTKSATQREEDAGKNPQSGADGGCSTTGAAAGDGAGALALALGAALVRRRRR